MHKSGSDASMPESLALCVTSAICDLRSLHTMKLSYYYDIKYSISPAYIILLLLLDHCRCLDLTAVEEMESFTSLQSEPVLAMRSRKETTHIKLT